jgi:hypothetical protein
MDEIFRMDIGDAGDKLGEQLAAVFFLQVSMWSMWSKSSPP